MMEVSGTLLVQYDDPANGNASAFTEVTVYKVDINGDKTVATLYMEDDVTGPTRDNPFLTNARGRYSFFVENGVYSIEWNSGLSSILVQAFDLRALNALSKDLNVVRTSAATIDVDGNDHGTWYISENDSAEEVMVNIGYAMTDDPAPNTPAPGTIILVTQATEVNVKFASQFPGQVSVRSPGELRAYGQFSTVGLMAASTGEWYLVGDFGTDFGATSV